jgi:DNA-binding NarL/FixJ family response regulator
MKTKPKSKAAAASPVREEGPITAPGSGERARIMIVDDHPLTRAGLMHVLNKQPDLVVWREASTSSEAIELLATDPPDLLVADLGMPGRGGFELIKDALAVRPGLRILVLSMHDEMLYAERALRLGARGYVMKEAGAETVLRALRTILSGNIYVSAKVESRILENLSAGAAPSAIPIQLLTDRELQVLNLIGQGHSTKEIATELKLSTKTIDVYRGNIKEKLNLSDAVALVRYAVCWVETQTLAGPATTPP